MITGIGYDMVSLPRLRELVLRRPKLPSKLLTESELKEYAARHHAVIYLAGRIAAKEALGKALRTGIRAPATWRRMSVLSLANGAPEFHFAPALSSALKKRGIDKCHLSISHDGDYAAAFVVAERVGESASSK